MARVICCAGQLHRGRLLEGRHRFGRGAAQQRGDAVGQPFGVILFPIVRRGGAFADRDQRHAETVGGVAVVERLDRIIADELVMIKLFGVPIAPHPGLDHELFVRRFDRVGLARFDLMFAAQQPQCVLERLVIQIAGGAKLWIVGVALPAGLVAEQIIVRGGQGDAVVVQRVSGLSGLFGPFALDVRQFGQGVDQFRIGMLSDPPAYRAETMATVATKMILQGKPPQHAFGPFGQSRSAPGDQLQRRR